MNNTTAYNIESIRTIVKEAAALEPKSAE